jgi:hypothetical protein
MTFPSLGKITSPLWGRSLPLSGEDHFPSLGKIKDLGKVERN